MADDLPRAIAVTVLTGFLGSGKTTLLNHLLKDPDLSEAAVLINEFGDVSIDHLLVDKIDETTVLLESGCICCSVRGDLVDAMRDLIAKRADGRVPYFERLMIETTGLADPAPILHTLMSDPLIAGQYRLDGLIATVDGVLGDQTLDTQDEALKQIAIADRIVLTKTDLVGDLTPLKSRLKDLNPTAQIIEAQHGVVAAKDLINAGLFDEDFVPHAERWLGNHEISHHGHTHSHAHRHAHDASIRTFVLEAEGPIDFGAFQDWLETLLATQGANVLRLKGIMDVRDVDRPVAVHGVQHVFHPPATLPSWEGLDKRTRLVFITRNLSEQAVRDTFKAHIPGQLVEA